MTLHAYIDYKYIGPVSGESMISELCKLQFEHAEHGQENKHTFTILNRENGYAFSQEYYKLPNNMAWHSRVWKHELDVTIPNDISFNDLEKLIS